MQGFPRADYLCGYFAQVMRVKAALYPRQAAWEVLREPQLRRASADALEKLIHLDAKEPGEREHPCRKHSETGHTLPFLGHNTHETHG